MSADRPRPRRRRSTATALGFLVTEDGCAIRLPFMSWRDDHDAARHREWTASLAEPWTPRLPGLNQPPVSQI